MLDLSKIKEIKISEGSVTKITDSSGVVLWQKVVTPSASLDVDLNNQWIASTKTLDGYKVYMSNSNHNVNNGYASMKFKFKGMPNFKLWINSYAESSYDYTIAWNLDRDYPTGIPNYADNGAKASTKGKQYNPTNITAFTEVDYSNDGGEHFVVVTYRKDNSVNNNDDRGYVAIKLTLISTTWVVSSTEFIKKDDKYYEKLNEVGTYEGGFTANTGNYKEGNELTVTYKQGTADDFMVTDGKMYYKNYIYVTPKDQEINTGDYIQGDYIGEATPSMKVTYKDGSNKTFYNLTSIDKNTDSNKANAKSVEIYDSVTSIGGRAFYGCSNLTSITIPNSVTSIGNDVFTDCSSLTSVTIPTGVTRIEMDTFESCSSLTSITIPDSVTFIGYQAFRLCKSLTCVTIPNSVTRISNSAFEFCRSLTGITIPSGVTRIENSTFNNCSSLSSITIPNSVTYIENLAFKYCESLVTVTIQNSTSKLAYNTNAFANISSTAKLYVPSNLLADYQSDSSWTGAFGGGIYAIPPSMKVTYNDGTEKTFYNLTSIEQDTDPNKVNAKSVEIYDGVTIIGDAAFRDCNSLATVTIENSTSKLAYNSNAFANIASNAKLYVPSNLLSDYQSDTSWTGAFGGGIYAIPPSMKVTYNDGTEKTFYNLTSIEQDTDPNKVNAKSVEIYDGVTIIDERAFFDCEKLTSITLGNSVTSIGEDAFMSCKSLTSITLGNSVTSIDDAAFYDCSSLASVTIQNSNNELAFGKSAFYNISPNAKLFVPSNLLADYQSDSSWTYHFKGGIYAIPS